MGEASKAQQGGRRGDAVRAALEKADSFRSAQDIYASMRATGNSVGLSTVYRHLQALADAGRADVIQARGGEATYRLCGVSRASHHHHLVCRACGQAVEVAGRAVEEWATRVAAEHGYQQVDHTVEVFGICPRCAPARRRGDN